MKKLILAVALVAASVGAAHADNDHWSYEEKTNTGDTCYYLQNSETGKAFLALGNAVPESLYKECENNGSQHRAEKDLIKHPQRNVMQEATDTYKACVMGAEVNGAGFAGLVSNYKGNIRMINTLRKANSYGYNVARTYRDCTNYVMGY